MGRGDTADSWGLLSRVSSEPSFEVKMDVFLIEILRAGGWLPQPNTYSMQGKWYAQGPKLLSANPGICLCILCWGMWSFLRSHWGRQRRELQQKICAVPEIYTEKLGGVLCSHQKSTCFFCTMRIHKHFCKTYPSAVPKCKEIVRGHEQRDPFGPMQTCVERTCIAPIIITTQADSALRPV